MGSFPYYSHTTPIRIPKDMGMVWEASHKGVPLLGVPEKFPYHVSLFKSMLVRRFDEHETLGVSEIRSLKAVVCYELQTALDSHVPGSKLPLFPYNRGWSSTQY